VNVCPTCGLDFHSVATFDEHRVGTHDYTFEEGVRRDPPVYDGRRCLHVSEMEEAGFSRDRWGRWQLPAALEPHLVERVNL
jgi:hypothetical protein